MEEGDILGDPTEEKASVRSQLLRDSLVMKTFSVFEASL